MTGHNKKEKTTSKSLQTIFLEKLKGPKHFQIITEEEEKIQKNIYKE